MPIVIDDDLIEATGLSEQDVRKEIALSLFAAEKLTMGQAVRLSGLDRLSFQQLLAQRRIPLHYGAEDLRQDVATLDEAGLS